MVVVGFRSTFRLPDRAGMATSTRAVDLVVLMRYNQGRYPGAMYCGCGGGTRGY